MISVAIATYNRAAMVKEAVEAALTQSRMPDEIIVSDDASTDGTLSVLREMAARDARVRVIEQASNTGGVGNWNRAMRETRGDFIAWCSDDDRFTPDHLRASLEYLQAHPDTGVVHSSFIDSIERGGRCELTPRRLRSTQPIVADSSNLIGYLLRYYDWPFHPSTLVMRREVWESVGEFDPRFALADTDWFVRAAQITKIAMLARHGAINRRHAGNWSNRVGSAEMQREIFEIVERAIGRRPIWRWLWRMNVRARLGLTLRARIRAGYAEAACAAWHGMLQNTGGRTPDWIESIGERWIRRKCAGREARGAAEEVSPL